MIINAFTLTYLLCAAASLVTVGVASVVGVDAGWRWSRAREAEARYRLEKRAYLVVTLLVVAFAGRLCMLPLWFLALHSLIPSLPGALCLVGVHQANAPTAAIASGLKLVAPAMYFYWLQLHRADRRLPRQPLVRAKLLLLAPIGLFTGLELGLDLRFFFTLPLRRVSCCVSLIDPPAAAVAATGAPAAAVPAVAVLLLGVGLWWQLQRQARAAIRQARESLRTRQLALSQRSAWLTTALTLATVVAYGLVLHLGAPQLTKGALGGPCIFCVVQGSGAVALALVCLVAAASWQVACAWAVCHPRFPLEHPDVMTAVGRSLRGCQLLYAGAAALTLVPLLG